MRSGVNWMPREALPRTVAPGSSAASVLARPGTPSSRQWPPGQQADQQPLDHAVLADDDRASPRTACARVAPRRLRWHPHPPRSDRDGTGPSWDRACATPPSSGRCEPRRLYVRGPEMDFGCHDRRPSNDGHDVSDPPRKVDVDAEVYDARWERLAAAGASVHGEADLVEHLLRDAGGGSPGHASPARVLDAGCGTGRVRDPTRGAGLCGVWRRHRRLAARPRSGQGARHRVVPPRPRAAGRRRRTRSVRRDRARRQRHDLPRAGHRARGGAQPGLPSGARRPARRRLPAPARWSHRR